VAVRSRRSFYGVWGAISGAPVLARDRGAPRFIRGATSAGAFGAVVTEAFAFPVEGVALLAA